ncbi:MAG: hypothetical protein A2Y34_15380 [Spirochaetes bacterium GWC1_27_15]|nr:MAG: hypothetical protein A2Z98_09240 [Spirochaetes bacterium GWB1_27_13]OHD23666.1 MAG: hypothetical protein A2Y34_15380 [Spirochaetes bacterium GWC1_27_15]
MNKKTKFLHTPPGSKPFYKEEAILRNSIEKTLSNFFEKWGFFPIETPIIDYFDVYSPIFSDELRKNTIKFVDKDGEVILLRNDITLFAAKLIASRIADNNDMLKYYYSDAVMRYEKSDSLHEYYQIGCEIVGDNFTYQEIEVLSILLESLPLLEINDYILHIGDVSFYQNLLESLPKENLYKILDAIRLRDKRTLLRLLDENNLSEDIKNDCLLASTFIGSLSELENLGFSQKTKPFLDNLINIGKILYSLGYKEQITFDLSELSKLNYYYNGIIFHLYSKGVETPLVSGGRYDLLFRELGIKKCAVGFSFWLYPLEKLLTGKDFSSKEDVENILIEKSPEQSFKDAIKKVRENKKIDLIYGK